MKPFFPLSPWRNHLQVSSPFASKCSCYQRNASFHSIASMEFFIAQKGSLETRVSFSLVEVRKLLSQWVLLAVVAPFIGGILFVFGNTFGSFLLVRGWLYCEADAILNLKSSAFKAFVVVFVIALTFGVLYDFYNYRPGKPKYNHLLNEFMLNLIYSIVGTFDDRTQHFLGALLFFIGMKNSTPRSQLRKKIPKAKIV
ncbi:hypothetical protein V8G54_036368 [Vigna mungo]|uniref:Uncharacterized protein n=1 Tax=Vigna mungo TaxID=3915 RepID=A0AAQ3MIA8_VIGMU